MRLLRSIRIWHLAFIACVLMCPACVLAQTASGTPTAPAANAIAGSTQVQTVATGFTRTTRVLVLGGATVLTFLLYFFLSGLHPLRLIVGHDNRYSNSKFQVALWFFVLITTYIAAFWLRLRSGVVGPINIPEHLLLLSGISAATYAAAKGITTSKVNDAQAQGLSDPKNAAASPSLLQDLTHNDGTAAQAVAVAAAGVVADTPVALVSPGRVPSLDLGDTQMIIVTLLAVATYIYATLHFMGNIGTLTAASTTLPDVDTTILSIFGIGQGAYLTKKAVGNVGQS